LGDAFHGTGIYHPQRTVDHTKFRRCRCAADKSKLERAEHDALVALVERILAAKRVDAAAEQPSRGATACQAVSAWACPAEARRRRKREIGDPPSLNNKLRRAQRVYRLYGLTAAEIKIVEGKRKG
jgi:hypothetical protein